MSTENFAYWLQGFFEISNTKTLTEEQVAIIKNHLALVFNKKTPDVNTSFEQGKNEFDEMMYDLCKPLCSDC